jgi:uncharacterized protein YqgV (UPF0045/DUF77 family)
MGDEQKTAIKHMLQDCKRLAAEKFVASIIEVMREEGMGFKYLIDGAASYAHKQNLDEVTRLLEKAATAMNQKH